MKSSDYEFAYIVVKYNSGIHRVQRIRSPYNGNIFNRIPAGNGIVASCKNRFIGEAYLTYEEAFYKMVELHDKHKTKVYWKMKIISHEYGNLSSRDKEIIREGKLRGYYRDVLDSESK